MNLPISTDIVSSITRTLTALIPYGWGKKAQANWDWHVFLLNCKDEGVDCSGWIAWLLYQASHGAVHLTGGSWEIKNQLAAMASQHGDSNRGHYLIEAAKHDGILRICGFAPKGAEAGHIWGVLNGVTTESHGPEGHSGGVRPRRFDYHTLADNAEWVFDVAGPASKAVAKAPVAALPAAPPPVARTLKVLDGDVTRFTDKAGVIFYGGSHWLLARDLANVFPGVQLDNATEPGTLRIVVAAPTSGG